MEPHPRAFSHLGPSSSLLLNNVESMYWRSVHFELVSLIFSLHCILSNKSLIPELDEQDIAYTSEQQRLSIRIIPYIKDWWPFPQSPESDDFDVRLAHEALFGVDGKEGARAHQNKPTEYRLARAMLTSLGILDISKIVEYRTPQFPSQCGDPQLAVFDDRVEPTRKGRMDIQFISRTCNDCDKVFRAPYYECCVGCPHKDYKDTMETFAVCALCYRTTMHDPEHLRRQILQSDISETVAKELCKCPGVENPLFVSIDFDNQDFDAWAAERHKSGKTFEGHIKTCQYLAMESKRRGCVATVNDTEDKAQAKKLRKDDAKYEPRFSEKLLKMFPKHVRKNYYAMGNVHAAIMFGPLLIENGVARTKRGAVISSREPPDLGAIHTSIPGLPQATRDQLNNILVVSGDDSRELYSAEDKTLRKRRLNASITQVLGGLFSTHESTWRTTEETVIEMVLQAAKDYKPQIMLQQRQQQTASLLQVADHIVALLKNSIGRDVRHYLHLLLYQIPDRRFPLEWKLTSNNCQTFCDNLLRSFLTVFPPNIDKTASSPLTPNYLLSFTARFPALSDATFVASRLDSYFRAFHRELDIIDFHDSETEYPPSNDSEFELVNCERILLWKCMGEECNLADHMFRHASDSISILKFHVQRPRTAYWRCAPGSMRPQQLDHGEWLRQRVQVMLGIDIFHGLAAGIVQTFRRIAHSVVEEDVDFIDAEEFEAEEALPYASVETWEGNTYIDPDTGLERRTHIDNELFNDRLHESEEGAESRYGVWSPGSSDTVGRKGPQWMADTEASERMVLEFRNTK